MLYLHATIITINPTRDIILDGGILVHGNLIADIGKAEPLKGKYVEEEVMDLTGRIVIPGLVSTHMHCAQSLLRGEATSPRILYFYTLILLSFSPLYIYACSVLHSDDSKKAMVSN